MASTTNIKVAVLGIFTILFFIWLASGTISKAVGSSELDSLIAASATPTPKADSDAYVGAETCKACHEPQFNSVAATKHGKLENLASWKGKVTGCEACHGPGKEHVEFGGDKSKIIVFKTMNPKAVSETCLGCHAGRESHNNFRRGEHWRNNVGCTDCHTAHGSNLSHEKTNSITLVSDASRQNPRDATVVMLK